MKPKAVELGADVTWKEMEEGAMVLGPGTSRYFNTGEWTSVKPVFKADKCVHCLMCVPVCPDSSIPVRDMKRLEFDYDHCKGCGICAVNCPFGAIEMEEVE